MDAAAIAGIAKVVSEYGVLGLGWIAWILTMGYLQVERKRYQALVVHIVMHFTKVNMVESGEPITHLEEGLTPEHTDSYSKLFRGVRKR